MRAILMVINSLAPAGAEMQVMHLARALAQRGDRITIVCLKRRWIDVDSLTRDGVRVIALNAVGRRARVRALPRLTRLAASADVVHCMTWDATLWARLAALLARRPVVVTEHSGGRDIQVSRSNAARGHWIARHNRLLDGFTSAVVACARWQIELLESEGVRRSHLVHLPNGVPADEIAAAARRGPTRAALGIDPAAKVVIHVGRLHELKNQRQTLDTVARLREQLGDVRAMFVGDGSDQALLERRAREMGADWAMFMGARDDVPALLALADLAVLPSRVEAMPMSLLEAIAVGVPVVANDVGDVGLVLERTGAGVAVAPGDTEAFVDACRNVLTDELLAGELRSHARASRHYGVESMADAYSDLFDAAIRGGPARPRLASASSRWRR